MPLFALKGGRAHPSVTPTRVGMRSPRPESHTLSVPFTHQRALTD